MQTIHLSGQIMISTKIQNFKMINLTHMISILNSVFTVVLYVTEMDKTRSHLHIFFKN
jgi:hypothetical protein